MCPVLQTQSMRRLCLMPMSCWIVHPRCTRAVSQLVVKRQYCRSVSCNVIAWADCLVTGGNSGHYSVTCSSLLHFHFIKSKITLVTDSAKDWQSKKHPFLIVCSKSTYRLELTFTSGLIRNPCLVSRTDPKDGAVNIVAKVTFVCNSAEVGVALQKTYAILRRAGVGTMLD